VLTRYVPQYAKVYQKLQWRMYSAIDRVYDNSRARKILGWQPQYTFTHALNNLEAGEDYRSPFEHS